MIAAGAGIGASTTSSGPSLRGRAGRGRRRNARFWRASRITSPFAESHPPRKRDFRTWTSRRQETKARRTGMAKTALSPWHKVVQLREDVRTGELTLAQFAADLYDVHIGRARPIYQDPSEFFALTYPTYSLRELAKDVILRLAGRSEKAVRSLKLTYGGGKTHALITLYHLTTDPDRLPDLPAVGEFVQHAGQRPPRARVVVLPFDKLDVERGMEVRGPGGAVRWLRQPWSV